MIKISPSVMTADFCYLGDMLKELEKGQADYIHCDVMDGVFVPNISFGMPMVRAMNNATDLPLDVHLMIDDPTAYIDEFVDCGADIITVHYESRGCVHLNRILNKIKDRGIKAGVAINPSTNVDLLECVYDLADMILVMSVNPGFGGQSFIESSLKKIERVANRLSQLNIKADIEVDGGVKPINSKSIINAGATILVAGSAVCDSPNKKEAIKLLRGI